LKHRKRNFLFLIIIFFLIAWIIFWMSSPKKVNLDSGLLTGKPCQAPCWQGLTPGQSKVEDVNRFVNALDPKVWVGRAVRDQPSGCKSIRVTDNQDRFSVTQIVDLQIENGFLTFIGSFPSVRPQLNEVVSHFGPPEFVESKLAVGPDGSFYILEIYYPRLGVAFGVIPNQNDIGNIESNMRIDSIQYFPPGDLLSYLTVRNSCDVGIENAKRDAAEEITKFIRPWTGFGKVEVFESRPN
jgi:hypothetical protein